MRISDWSSDVCSSDLADQQTIAAWYAKHSVAFRQLRQTRLQLLRARQHVGLEFRLDDFFEHGAGDPACQRIAIGRASCRERVCQYVYFSVVDTSLTKNYTKYRYQQTTHPTQKQ